MKSRKNVRSLVFKIINIAVVVGLGALLVIYLLSKINNPDASLFSVFKYGFSDLRDGFLHVKESIMKVYVPSLVIGFILWFVMDFFKTYRQLILIGSPDVRYGDMFLVTLIRDAFNMVLPARTGELSYVYVLKRKFKIPVEIGVSTLAIGLIFELIIVFFMVIISIIIVGINRYSISSTNVILIVVGLLVLSILLLFFLSKFINFFIRIVGFLMKRFKKLEKSKVFHYLYDKLIQTNVSIDIIRKRRIYWKVALLSIATRAMKYTSYYFFIHAFLKSAGYDFYNLPYWEVLLASIAAEISAILPTHAVAGLGTYEFAFVSTAVALNLLPQGDATTAGFGYHIVNLSFTVLQGLIAVIILVLPFYRSRRDAAIAEKADSGPPGDNGKSKQD